MARRSSASTAGPSKARKSTDSARPATKATKTKKPKKPLQSSRSSNNTSQADPSQSQISVAGSSKARKSTSSKRPVSKTAKTKKPQSSRSSVNTSQVDFSQSQSSEYQTRKRKRQDELSANIDSDDDFFNPPVPRPFSYLKAKKRHVDQALIMSEWKRLPAALHQPVRDLLTAARRSVVTELSTKRGNEAEKAIEGLQRRIAGRMPSMPFPPNTKDTNFNLEKLLEKASSLENQLTATLHSIDLLNAEIENEEEELQVDKDDLALLERNAQREQTLWKQQRKNTSTIFKFPSADDPAIAQFHPDKINLAQEPKQPFDFEEAIQDDPELEALVLQLKKHVQGIRDNSRQSAGVSDAMMQTAMALG